MQKKALKKRASGEKLASASLLMGVGGVMLCAFGVILFRLLQSRFAGTNEAMGVGMLFMLIVAPALIGGVGVLLFASFVTGMISLYKDAGKRIWMALIGVALGSLAIIVCIWWAMDSSTALMLLNSTM